MAGLMDWAMARLEEGTATVRELLSAPRLPFDESLRSRLPERHGIYSIYSRNAAPGEILRAGRTKTAAGGLRQRIYSNHLMGNQPGNLRAQLVRDGACKNLEEAKLWLQGHCTVQFVVIEDAKARCWAEHFMLSILRPKYSD